MNLYGRMTGQSLTDEIMPKVSVMTKTENPVGSLFSIWFGSKNNMSISADDAQALYDDKAGYLISHEDYPEEWREIRDYILKCYPEYAGADGTDYHRVIREVARLNLLSNVPAGECVHFTFQIDDANVAWREQLVRSKIASYWTQTTRTADMTSMDINMSPTVRLLGGEKAVDIYKQTTDVIRDAYKQLIELGVPVEDIRLQPQQHVHRVYWMTSLRSLIPIISKRSDWIAQISLWGPIVSQVVKTLRDIDPLLASFAGKPTPNLSWDYARGHHFVSEHKYEMDNEDRFYDKDPMPVDPLWLAYRGVYMPEHTDLEFYNFMKGIFINLWDDEYLDALGWDRNDPSHVGPYDLPKSKISLDDNRRFENMGYHRRDSLVD